MKKQDVTFQDKLNELRLAVAHPNCKGVAFLLVEGDSDIRLYRKLFNLTLCKVEQVPGGKFKLEDCVEEITKLYDLVAGIRDADFLRLHENEYDRKNMFLTDCHDMEMSLLKHIDVLNAVFFEYSDLPASEHEAYRDNVFGMLRPLSMLKWANAEETLELSVSVGFLEFLDVKDKKFDLEGFLSRVLLNSPNPVTSDEEVILGKVSSLESKNPDPFQLTNGHDFMSALAKYFNEKGLSKNLGKDGLAGACRMIFTKAHFAETELHQKLVSWGGSVGCPICS